MQRGAPGGPPGSCQPTACQHEDSSEWVGVTGRESEEGPRVPKEDSEGPLNPLMMMLAGAPGYYDAETLQLEGQTQTKLDS